MSNSEVAGIVEDLLNNVTEGEEWQMNEEETVDGAMSHPNRDQYGGAIVKVLKTLAEDGPEDYAENFKFIKLDVELPPTMMNNPNSEELFGDMVVNLVEKFKPNHTNNESRVGVTFHSVDFEDGTVVGLSMTPINKVTTQEIVRTLGLLSQSSKSPLEVRSPTLRIVLKYIIPPQGSGKRKAPFGMKDVLELNNLFAKRPQNMIENDVDDNMDAMDFLDDDVQESDGSGEESDFEINSDGEVIGEGRKRPNIMNNNVIYDCLPHALFQSWMNHQRKYGATERERQYGNKMLRASLLKNHRYPNRHGNVYDAVDEMKEEAGVTKRTNFTYTDIERFQSTVFATTLQIIAIIKHQAAPYYAGPYVGPNRTIVIYLEVVNGEGHYSGVRSLPALLQTKYYCVFCHVRCGSIALHYNCPLRHRVCGEVDCPETPQDLKYCCVKCTAEFRSAACLKNHLKRGPRNGKSRCENTRLCKKCNELYYTNKSRLSTPHDCGTKWCKRCQVRRPETHHCTLMPSKKNEKKLTHKRIFFDFECRADEETGEQVPVLFMALRCCPQCSSEIPKSMEAAEESTCGNCAPDGRFKKIECVTDDNRFVNVADEVTDWLFGKHHKGVVAIAHNAAGYDSQFILKNLIAMKKASPKVVTAGTKIIYLKYKNVKIIDSFKYLTMSLAAVGKSFQIETQKGDFPYGFITPENFDFIGPYPEDEYYNLENKTPAAKEKLLEFLNEKRVSNQIFNFVEEIFKYCFDDVYILAKSLVTFEENFEELTDVLPFEESVTAASAAMKVFQRKHLDPLKPIVLDARPAASMNCSLISQKYLAWFGQVEKVQVDASTTYGERKVGKYRVDGFVDPCDTFPRGLVIEFFGCFYHAHECKYSSHSFIGQKTAKQIRESDAERIEFLKNYYDVKIVWECEVEKERKTNPEMEQFFESYEPRGVLQCEKALIGGRTEVFKMNVKNNGLVIKFVDIVSLYPYVMKHHSFPIGPPRNLPLSRFNLPITKSYMLHARGFLNCRIAPPTRLELPLLAIKTNSRLVFALCLACARTMNQSSCHHTEEERSFNGTYTTVELKEALNLGYKITQVYHAIDYEHWAENDDNGKGGLFTSYINEMMVQKIYSSGWPPNIQTDEEKRDFIQEYREKEGIELNNPEKFVQKPGVRLSSKLLLNSLWGKLAQRVDRSSTEIVNNPAKFWKLFHDTSVVMEDVWCISNTVMVRYHKQEETLESLKTGAMHIAAYVPAYGRLQLYKMMQLVGATNIVYTDTDSIIYTHKISDRDPLQHELGPFLGQLTSELCGTMTEFVTIGPKTYCFKQLVDGEEKIMRKSKGITLTAEADKKVTFDAMKKMVTEVLENAPNRTTLQVPQQTMRRDRDHNIFTKHSVKAFRFTFNKRRLLSDGSTLPFGFVDEQ